MIGWDPSLYDAMIDVDKIVEIENLDTKYSKYTSEIHTHIRKFMIEAIGQDCYGFPDPLGRGFPPWIFFLFFQVLLQQHRHRSFFQLKRLLNRQ